jgi:hypothetical protein
MNIDYLPDEMNAYAKGMKLPEISEFYRGWRAACEAMAAKAQANGEVEFVSPTEAALDRESHPQPAPDWRAACVVEKCEDGDWDVVSPSGEFWLYEVRPCWMGFDDSVKRSKIGSFGCEISARAALAACPTPPPDAAEAARAT